MVGWAPPGGSHGLPLLPEAEPGWGRIQACGELSATLPDGWQALSVTELSQLKPLKVILLLILCGRSPSSEKPLIFTCETLGCTCHTLKGDFSSLMPENLFC